MTKREQIENKMKALLKTFPTAILKEILLKDAVDFSDGILQKIVMFQGELSTRIGREEFEAFCEKTDKMSGEAYDKTLEVGV